MMPLPNPEPNRHSFHQEKDMQSYEDELDKNMEDASDDDDDGSTAAVGDDDGWKGSSELLSPFTPSAVPLSETITQEGYHSHASFGNGSGSAMKPSDLDDVWGASSAPTNHHVSSRSRSDAAAGLTEEQQAMLSSLQLAEVPQMDHDVMMPLRLGSSNNCDNGSATNGDQYHSQQRRSTAGGRRSSGGHYSTAREERRNSKHSVCESITSHKSAGSHTSSVGASVKFTYKELYGAGEDDFEEEYKSWERQRYNNSIASIRGGENNTRRNTSSGASYTSNDNQSHHTSTSHNSGANRSHHTSYSASFHHGETSSRPSIRSLHSLHSFSTPSQNQNNAQYLEVENIPTSFDEGLVQTNFRGSTSNTTRQSFTSMVSVNVHSRSNSRDNSSVESGSNPYNDEEDVGDDIHENNNPEGLDDNASRDSVGTNQLASSIVNSVTGTFKDLLGSLETEKTQNTPKKELHLQGGVDDESDSDASDTDDPVSRPLHKSGSNETRESSPHDLINQLCDAYSLSSNSTKSRIAKQDQNSAENNHEPSGSCQDETQGQQRDTEESRQNFGGLLNMMFQPTNKRNTIDEGAPMMLGKDEGGPIKESNEDENSSCGGGSMLEMFPDHPRERTQFLDESSEISRDRVPSLFFKRRFHSSTTTSHSSNNKADSMSVKSEDEGEHSVKSLPIPKNNHFSFFNRGRRFHNSLNSHIKGDSSVQSGDITEDFSEKDEGDHSVQSEGRVPFFRRFHNSTTSKDSGGEGGEGSMDKKVLSLKEQDESSSVVDDTAIPSLSQTQSTEKMGGNTSVPFFRMFNNSVNGSSRAETMEGFSDGQLSQKMMPLLEKDEVGSQEQTGEGRQFIKKSQNSINSPRTETVSSKAQLQNPSPTLQKAIIPASNKALPQATDNEAVIEHSNIDPQDPDVEDTLTPSTDSNSSQSSMNSQPKQQTEPAVPQQPMRKMYQRRSGYNGAQLENMINPPADDEDDDDQSCDSSLEDDLLALENMFGPSSGDDVDLFAEAQKASQSFTTGGIEANLQEMENEFGWDDDDDADIFAKALQAAGQRTAAKEDTTSKDNLMKDEERSVDGGGSSSGSSTVRKSHTSSHSSKVLTSLTPCLTSKGRKEDGKRILNRYDSTATDASEDLKGPEDKIMIHLDALLKNQEASNRSLARREKSESDSESLERFRPSLVNDFKEAADRDSFQRRISTSNSTRATGLSDGNRKEEEDECEEESAVDWPSPVSSLGSPPTAVEAALQDIVNDDGGGCGESSNAPSSSEASDAACTSKKEVAAGPKEKLPVDKDSLNDNSSDSGDDIVAIVMPLKDNNKKTPNDNSKPFDGHESEGLSHNNDCNVGSAPGEKDTHYLGKYPKKDLPDVNQSISMTEAGRTDGELPVAARHHDSVRLDTAVKSSVPSLNDTTDSKGIETKAGNCNALSPQLSSKQDVFDLKECEVLKVKTKIPSKDVGQVLDDRVKTSMNPLIPQQQRRRSDATLRSTGSASIDPLDFGDADTNCGESVVWAPDMDASTSTFDQLANASATSFDNALNKTAVAKQILRELKANPQSKQNNPFLFMKKLSREGKSSLSGASQASGNSDPSTVRHRDVEQQKTTPKSNDADQQKTLSTSTGSAEEIVGSLANESGGDKEALVGSGSLVPPQTTNTAKSTKESVEESRNEAYHNHLPKSSFVEVSVGTGNIGKSVQEGYRDALFNLLQEDLCGSETGEGRTSIRSGRSRGSTRNHRQRRNTLGSQYSAVSSMESWASPVFNQLEAIRRQSDLMAGEDGARLGPRASYNNAESKVNETMGQGEDQGPFRRQSPPGDDSSLSSLDSLASPTHRFTFRQNNVAKEQNPKQVEVDLKNEGRATPKDDGGNQLPLDRHANNGMMAISQLEMPQQGGRVDLPNTGEILHRGPRQLMERGNSFTSRGEASLSSLSQSGHPFKLERRMSDGSKSMTVEDLYSLDGGNDNKDSSNLDNSNSFQASGLGDDVALHLEHSTKSMNTYYSSDGIDIIDPNAEEDEGRDDFDFAMRAYENAIKYGHFNFHDDEETSKAAASWEGNDQILAARAYMGLGFARQCKGELESSLDAYTKALTLWENEMGLMHSMCASIQYTIGTVLIEMSRQLEASDHFTKALHLFKHSGGTPSATPSPCSDNNRANILSTEGMLFSVLGEAKRAIECFRKTVLVFQTPQASMNLKFATVMFEMGSLLSQTGEYDESATCFNYTLKIRKAMLGDSFVLARTHYSLGVTQASRELNVPNDGANIVDAASPSLAATHLEEALRICQQEFDAEHLQSVIIVHALGVLSERKGDFLSASVWFAKERNMRKSLFGEDHETVATVSADLGTCYYNSGKYELAVSTFEDGLRIILLADTDRSLDVAEALYKIASCHDSLCNYDDALEKFYEVKKIREALFGVESSPVIQTMLRIGNIQLCKGEVKKALDCFSEVLGIGYASDSVNAVEVANALYGRGCAQFCGFHLADAMKSLSESLNWKLAALGEDDPGLACIFYQMAHVYLEQSEPEEAITCFEEYARLQKLETQRNLHDNAEICYAEGIVAKLKGRQDAALSFYNQALVMFGTLFGGDHEKVASIHFDIGCVHSAMGNHEDALGHFQTCLLQRRKLLGGHVDVANTLYEMGSIYHEQCRVQLAVKCLTEADRIWKAKLKNNEKMTSVLLLSAKLWKSLQCYQAAEENFEQALEQAIAIYGQQHDLVASILLSLGELLQEINQIQQALFCFDESIQVRTALHGLDSPSVAQVEYSKGVALLFHGNFEDASNCLDRALAIRQEKLGPMDGAVGDTLNTIGFLQLRMGNISGQEALDPLTKALEIRRAVGNKSKVVSTLQNIASVYKKRKQYVSCMETHAEILAVRQQECGSNDASVADAWINLGNIQISAGKLVEATVSYEEALRIRTLANGYNHISVARVLFKIGSLNSRQNNYTDAKQLFEEYMRIRAEEEDDPDEEMAQALTLMGDLQKETGEKSKAQINWMSALEIYQQLGYPENHPKLSKLRARQRSVPSFSFSSRKSVGDFSVMSFFGAGSTAQGD